MTEINQLEKVRSALEKIGIDDLDAEIKYFSQNPIEVSAETKTKIADLESRLQETEEFSEMISNIED